MWEWHVCEFVEAPYLHVENIHPMAQAQVGRLVDYVKGIPAIKRVIVFGSSVTPWCYPDSDIDIYVVGELNGCIFNPPRMLRDAPFDILFSSSFRRYGENEPILREILKTGVIVYEKDVT